MGSEFLALKRGQGLWLPPVPCAGQEKSRFLRRCLLQTELYILKGTDRPFRNLILWPNRSAQKGRMFRIEPDGVGDFFRAEIGVAIVASVPAGVIGADVDALDTPARCALVAVFGGAEGTADDPLDQVRVDAASVLDTHRL